MRDKPLQSEILLTVVIKRVRQSCVT